MEAALGDLEWVDLPAKTIAALCLVDLLSAPQPIIDTATYQRLRTHLDARELLELGAALSVAVGWQRFIECSVSSGQLGGSHATALAGGRVMTGADGPSWPQPPPRPPVRRLFPAA